VIKKHILSEFYHHLKINKLSAFKFKRKEVNHTHANRITTLLKDKHFPGPSPSKNFPKRQNLALITL